MYFPLIDVLRGFAALSVLVYHVVEHFGWTDFPTSGALLWFRIGWLGVDLFFVISGFVIALSAFSLIDKMGEKRFRVPYVERRFRRIAPLYYLTCVVFLAFILPQIIFTENFLQNAAVHLLFVHNWFPMLSGSINGVNWSVSVEMQFYLLILLLAPPLRVCRWWLIPLIAMPLAWAWRMTMFQLVPIDPQFRPFYLFWASTQLPGMLDEFAIGILLARLVRSGDAVAALRLARRQAWLPTLLAGGLVWLALAIFWRQPNFWDAMPMVVFWRSLAALACGAVVLAACCWTNALLVRVTLPLRYLGTISYGIYLWHLPVIMALKRIDWLTGPRALPYVIVITLLLASGSWFFFERAFLKSAKPQPAREPAERLAPVLAE